MLTQTLEWSAEALERLFDQSPDLPADYVFSERAAAVDWLLEGDAAQRGLIAATLSRAEIHDASGSSWMAPLLASLLDDPEYPALRLIAQRTIHSLPGFDELDLSGDQPRDLVIERWRRLGVEDRRGVRVYQTPSGELDVGRDRCRILAPRSAARKRERVRARSG